MSINNQNIKNTLLSTKTLMKEILDNETMIGLSQLTIDEPNNDTGIKHLKNALNVISSFEYKLQRTCDQLEDVLQEIYNEEVKRSSVRSLSRFIMEANIKCSSMIDYFKQESRLISDNFENIEKKNVDDRLIGSILTLTKSILLYSSEVFERINGINLNAALGDEVLQTPKCITVLYRNLTNMENDFVALLGINKFYESDYMRFDGKLDHFNDRLYDVHKLVRNNKSLLVGNNIEEFDELSSNVKESLRNIMTHIDEARHSGDTYALRDALETAIQNIQDLQSFIKVKFNI